MEMGNARKKIIVVVALWALILGAVLGTGLLGSATEEKSMELMNDKNDGLIHTVGIPALDAAVPEKIETATFALG